MAKKVTSSHQDLNQIIMSATKKQIKSIIAACYSEVEEKRPLLFDGIGRVYPHSKACFYFFAWMIRDAPQQRLAPLIARMRKQTRKRKQKVLQKVDAETETLVELIFEYRSYVRSFDWLTVREVVIDRLEGSRRSIKGHHLEATVRTALITAFQNYYAIYGNYGKYYKKVSIADKQIKIGSHTIDFSAVLTSFDGESTEKILLPIKTRETEGGGHAHLFTRDIMAAVSDLKSDDSSYHILAVIIAQNWSISELGTINAKIDRVFHFNLNPNNFLGFDNETQIKLNKYIQGVLNHG